MEKEAKFGISVEVEPMEAKSAVALPTGTGWQYEPKWDGFKCIAFKSGGDVDLRAKSGKPLGRYFPELIAFLAGLPVDRLRLSLSKSIRSLGRERRHDAVASYWKPRLTEGSIMTEKIVNPETDDARSSDTPESNKRRDD